MGTTDNYLEIDFHFTDGTSKLFMACKSYEVKNDLFYLQDDEMVIGIVPLKTVQYIRIK